MSDTMPSAVHLRKPGMPHALGRLFQQWCVDVFTCIEPESIEWCRRIQPLLRCGSLQGLADYLEAGAALGNVGAGANEPCPEAAST
eukprot:10514036-Karenia_brevis.AAC.1